MTNNSLIDNTQQQGFNVNINVNLNTGTAATALFVVLGVCCCMYINAKNNYTASMNYDNHSLSIGPSTKAAEA